jgi:hypothetical protein
VQELFVSPARLITRQPDAWYAPSGQWQQVQQVPSTTTITNTTATAASV